MCKVRCWRWLFGNKIPISLEGKIELAAHPCLRNHRQLISNAERKER
jgi:hypothetical protein